MNAVGLVELMLERDVPEAGEPMGICAPGYSPPRATIYGIDKWVVIDSWIEDGRFYLWVHADEEETRSAYGYYAPRVGYRPERFSPLGVGGWEVTAAWVHPRTYGIPE